jgi:hypothetical protein
MADDTSPSRQDSSPPPGRGPGNREPGGFRIRLSDNEMRAARAIQDAFQLRSTVAALGLAIRTVAQLLEDGQLDELVAQQRAQAGPRRSYGEGRPGQDRDRDGRGGRPERAPKANPFARPSKPAPAAVVITEGNPETDVPTGDDAAIDGSPVDGAADAGAETSPETSAEA